MIDVTIAQSIVDRMKNIINQELNFFSVTGTIIASTDPSRLGQENHGGALHVIATQAAVIIEYDNQYHGAKQGINLPVRIDNQIVGVIGITGQKQDVLHFGEIIKQMTEVLILNNTAREMVFNRRNMNQNIISSILQAEEDKEPSVEMFYGIDLNLSRTAIVGTTFSTAFSHLIDGFSSIYLELEQLIGNNNQNLFEIRGNLITILLQSENQEQTLKLTKAIQDMLLARFNLAFIFGIGMPSSIDNSLKNSILQAQSTLHWNKTLKVQSILQYTDMDYGILLNAVSQKDIAYYLEKVFKEMRSKDIEETLHLLNMYEKHNGAIQQCADALFIHKNTLQYKLNKIYQLTGYNPRQLKDFSILKLASILYQATQHTSQE